MDTADFDEYNNQTFQNEYENITQTDVIDNKTDVSRKKSEMSLADWRWAAQRGYWNPELRCWNEELGGISAYLEQRDKRRLKRLSRQPRTPKISGPSGYAITGSELNCAGSVSSQSNSKNINSTQLAANAKSRQVQEDSVIITGSVLLLKMARKGWGHHVARRFWNSGYDANTVVRLYDELPQTLHNAIGEVLNAAQLCADCGIPCGDAGICPAPRRPSHGDAMRMEWEQDAVHAFVEQRFDPATQACVGTAANARAAQLMGMRLEELKVLLERGDMPLPLPPLDAVAVFLHALGAAFEAVTTQYLRISPPDRPASGPEEERTDRSAAAAMAESHGADRAGAAAPAARAPPPPTVLVCCTNTKDCDAGGRVITVTCIAMY